MTLLDDIIFISDYCEETREHEECQRTRKKLLNRLSEICEKQGDEVLTSSLETLDFIKCEILGKTVKYLSEKGDFIHPATVLTFKETIGKYEGSKDFECLLSEYSQYMSAESESAGKSTDF